jgi:hypothetical protein
MASVRSAAASASAWPTSWSVERRIELGMLLVQAGQWLGRFSSAVKMIFTAGFITNLW